MTRLAFGTGSGHLSGRGSPPAGDVGRMLLQFARAAFGELKQGVSARSSWIFHDLQLLARENDIDAHESLLFEQAQRFLLALPGHLPAPELSLDADGEVSFDWSGPQRQVLTVTLREDGRLSYACWLSPNDRQHGTKQFLDVVPKAITECIQQVVGR